MRKSKMILGVVALAIMSLLFPLNNAFAKEAEHEWGTKYILIDSENELKEEFKNKNVTISGKTITLTGDVIFENEDYVEDSYDSPYKDVVFTGDDYVLNLNGYSLSICNLSVKGGSLTINDENGTGKIAAFIDVTPEDGTNNNPKLTINNGNLT